MPDNVVLDSSVIAAIFFKEEASERAEKVAEKHRLMTVDATVPEVANVAWKRIVHFNEPEEMTKIALKACMDFIANACKVISSQTLLEASFEIAVRDRITVYDSLFIAASEKEKAPLLTTDKNLYNNLCEKRNVKLV